MKIYAEVLDKNPNLFLKLKEKENIDCNGISGVVVVLECINSSPYYRNYMEELHLLQPSGVIVDTFYIRNTVDGDKLSFNWANISGENLKLATIRDSTIKIVNISKGMGIDYPVIGKINAGDPVIIDDYSENSQWVKCFTIDKQCRTIEGYIYRSSLSASEDLFFTLNIFDSLSVVVAMIIFVVIGCVFILLSSVITAILGNPWGFVPAVILILLLFYSIYQLLENILFKLFIINLPY